MGRRYQGHLCGKGVRRAQRLNAAGRSRSLISFGSILRHMKGDEITRFESKEKIIVSVQIFFIGTEGGGALAASPPPPPHSTESAPGITVD